MKHGLTHHLMAALLGVVFTAELVAQPTAFTYQGQFAESGIPATGLHDFEFTLYDSNQMGTLVGGPLTNNAVPVSGGLFTVMLDFGAGVFDGGERWLEIGVATNGSGVFANLSPRQLITSAPYAIQAGNAANASSVAAENITGNISAAQLPSAVVTNGATGVSISGTFSGDGSGVTNVSLLNVDSQGSIGGLGFFGSSSSPVVGASPHSVVAEDVNGDGRLDLISANTGTNTLTVLTNDGSGGFTLSSSPSVGNVPYSVTTADVNGDGHPDLISGHTSLRTNLTVLTNDGSGGFALSSSPIVGRRPISVATADVNGDDYVDLISANSGDSTLTVLTNDGSGGFALSSTPGVGNDPNSVVASDVNGDGLVDFITANWSGSTVTVVTNNGSGDFALSSTQVPGNNPISVAATDVNGDGQPDLISANSGSGSLTVLTNDGSGGFAISSSLDVGSYPYSVTAADVNGDGQPDLISADSGSDTLTVLTNDGSGAFALSAVPKVGNNPRSVAAADLNGDGRMDLISANSDDANLTVLFNMREFTGVFVGDGSKLTFTGSNVFHHASGSFSGNGSGLTNLHLNLLEAADGNPAKALYVDAEGDVGIGTTTPAAPLHVQTPNNVNASIQMRSGTGWYLVMNQSPGSVFTITNGGQERFRLEPGGNVGVGTNSPSARLHVVGNILATGTVTGSSDRNLKENLAQVDPQDVLERVSAMPIQRWNYIGEEVPHIGPVAQDFYGAFQVGVDDKHISMVDADGVALAAIQGLNQKLERENAELRKELQEIKQLLSNLTTKGSDQ